MAMKFKLIQGVHQYNVVENGKLVMEPNGEAKLAILLPGEEIISNIDMCEKFPCKFQRVQDVQDMPPPKPAVSTVLGDEPPKGNEPPKAPPAPPAFSGKAKGAA